MGESKAAEATTATAGIWIDIILYTCIHTCMSCMSCALHTCSNVRATRVWYAYMTCTVCTVFTCTCMWIIFLFHLSRNVIDRYM